jgi:hypothetical protein
VEEMQPTPETAAADTPVAGQPGRRQGSSFKRAAGAALLAVGLLTVGGVAIVNAASPDPSASTAPSATDNGTGGSTTPDASSNPDASSTPRSQGGSGTGQQGDCPNE